MALVIIISVLVAALVVIVGLVEAGGVPPVVGEETGVLEDEAASGLVMMKTDEDISWSIELGSSPLGTNLRTQARESES